MEFELISHLNLERVRAYEVSIDGYEWVKQCNFIGTLEYPGYATISRMKIVVRRNGELRFSYSINRVGNILIRLDAYFFDKFNNQISTVFTPDPLSHGGPGFTEYNIMARTWTELRDNFDQISYFKGNIEAA